MNFKQLESDYMKKYFLHESLEAFDVNKQHTREEIPQEATWDLSYLFSSDEEWEKAFDQLKSKIDIADQYAGKLAESADSLLAAFANYESILRDAELVGAYAHFKKDQDQGNSKYQAMSSKSGQLFAQLGGKLAFLRPELTQMDEQVFQGFVSEKPELALYEHFFEDIQRHKAHTLSQTEEILLAKAGDVFGTGAEVFSVFSNADLEFPKVNRDGEEIQITQANYIPLVESSNRDFRKDVFEKYYSTYKKYENTLALTLQKQIKQDNYFASVRNHENARAAALHNNAIPEQVFEQLQSTVAKNYSLLHEYVRVRKEKLGLDELHCYDLYVPMVENVDFKFTPSEAKKIVLEALKPLGEDYLEGIRKAFDERWIDWFSNKGKRSGAYSAGSTFDGKPYILLNWQGTIDSLYTLIHELGHSLHSYFSNSQPYIYSDYSIFLAEIASTTNENLLTDYLLKHEQDPARRKYIINHYLDGFKGTVFRQTQFARFEHAIHQADQNGTPLTAEFLNETYGQINQEFYGPDLYPDQEIAGEWIRIPHFYYNYYVYQYATGFSAATTFASQIIEEGEPARERYLNFLKAGGSDYPIEVLKKSGLDMTKPEPIEKALETFAHYLELFKNE